MKISKDQLFGQVMVSLLANRPVECSYDLLRFAFGFKRVDGMDYMLTKLLRPSVTEESMSYLSKDETIKNVINWAKENGFACCYNGNHSMNDSFTFYKFIEKQPQCDL